LSETGTVVHFAHSVLEQHDTTKGNEHSILGFLTVPAAPGAWIFGWIPLGKLFGETFGISLHVAGEADPSSEHSVWPNSG
jgi:hypothetical protein